MEQLKKLQILDGTRLKLLAMVLMLVDHIGMVLLPGHRWLRIVGRLAMPIFAFCVAEGFTHTRDRKRYCLRLALFGLLSEFPFDLALMGRAGWAHQNINPEVKIILTTSTSETSWEEMAKACGVESFWYKEYNEHSLLEIMDRTVAGEHVYPSSPPNQEFGKIRRSELTVRELDVLRELTNSLSNDEIATKLFISVNTVRFHIQNMLNKTGFENRLELAMNAKALGLVVSAEERTKSSKH